MPLGPPKISHALSWDETRASAYRVVNTLEFDFKNNSFMYSEIILRGLGNDKISVRFHPVAGHTGSEGE